MGDRAPKLRLESWGTYLPGQDTLAHCSGNQFSEEPLIPSGARRSAAGRALPTPPSASARVLRRSGRAAPRFLLLELGELSPGRFCQHGANPPLRGVSGRPAFASRSIRTSRANLPATICTSTRLLSLIKSACTRGKSCQYHTANIIIRLNLYDERAPTSKMGYVHQPGILCPVTQRVCTERNISGMPPEYLPLSGPVPALRQRAESCLVQLLQRSCNAPLVVSGGDRRQGRCNDPHKSSIEVHSSREGSKPAASRNG
jgi:hypothetical protein